MKILNFSVRGMHGHQTFDLKFFPDITFLVGSNGSGKTSALRLLQAAISLDLSVLSAIKFNELYLCIERTEVHRLHIIKDNTSLNIILDGESNDSKILLPGDDERKVYQSSGRINEYMEELRIKFLKQSSPRLRTFADRVRPLFLGLERKAGPYEDEVSQIYDEDIAYRVRRANSRISRDVVEGIDNCQALIERAYKQFRRSSDLNYSRLINVIVESLFDYIEFDHSWPLANVAQRELQILLERRREIEKFSADLGGGERANTQISKFFSRISQILENHIANPENTVQIELLLNKAQIQRILKILEEMDRQKKQSEKFYAPIKEIADTLNEYFKESRKIFEIDSVGKIKISHAGVAIPLEHLSSGEKQLLILMTHARFSRSKGGVFIVDEPELSLHMRWQEMLIGSLLDGNSNNQYILATHSPEIVGYRKNNCVQVG